MVFQVLQTTTFAFDLHEISTLAAGVTTNCNDMPYLSKYLAKNSITLLEEYTALSTPTLPITLAQLTQNCTWNDGKPYIPIDPGNAGSAQIGYFCMYVRHDQKGFG